MPSLRNNKPGFQQTYKEAMEKVQKEQEAKSTFNTNQRTLLPDPRIRQMVKNARTDRRRQFQNLISRLPWLESKLAQSTN